MKSIKNLNYLHAGLIIVISIIININIPNSIFSDDIENALHTVIKNLENTHRVRISLGVPKVVHSNEIDFIVAHKSISVEFIKQELQSRVSNKQKGMLLYCLRMLKDFSQADLAIEIVESKESYDLSHWDDVLLITEAEKYVKETEDRAKGKIHRR